MFTKLTGSIALLGLLLVGFNSEAQTTTATSATTFANADVKSDKKSDPATIETKAAPKPAEDTTWKPVRRLWGYAFGDFYYNAHADATNRGPETMYNGVPTYRNAFQFRRLYLGYDYDITKNFTAEVLLASEPNSNTGVNGTTSIQNGDNLVDGKMGFFIKNFNLRYRNIWNGTDFVIGEMSTPGFALNEPGTNAPTSLSEKTWGYRSIEKTITDFHKTNSYDVGAALQGTFDPSTKNFGYVFMVGNNSTSSLLGATNPNTGFYKIFYEDVWGKFFDQHLLIDIYADQVRTAPATAAIGGQSHGIWKAFVAYTSKKVSVGVEAYTQKITNGVQNTVAKAPEDATVHGLSLWVKGAIVKDKIGFFARYDGYNPDTQFNTADSYTANTNFGSYNPTVKETFYTAGLDFTPTKNVHFMPNLWVVNYKDQRDPATTGYVANDHTMVYRLTFFYTFGK
ncbi:MAG: hypothetical protein ACXVB0_16825 [Mucilaginibacter sp.]